MLQEAALALYRRSPGPLQRFAREVYGGVSEWGLGWDLGMACDSRGAYRRYRREYRDVVEPHLERGERRHRELAGHGKFGGLNRFTPHRLYAVVRDRSPDVVVETGVCNGVSSLVTLAALEENGTGRLLSVDLRDDERVPEGKDPGWIIPDELRDRWSLTMGDSVQTLPDVVDGVDSVDAFVHDTYGDILVDELEIVWPALDVGGIVVADDVHTNDSYGDVVERFPVDGGYLAPNVGLFVKQGDD